LVGSEIGRASNTKQPDRGFDKRTGKKRHVTQKTEGVDAIGRYKTRVTAERKAKEPPVLIDRGTNRGSVTTDKSMPGPFKW